MALTPSPTLCEPVIFAPPKAQERPAASFPASPKPGSTACLFAILSAELPGRFPPTFQWICNCGNSGFPGCATVKHFLERTYLALLDYHQVAASLEQDAFKQVGIDRRRQDQLLRIKEFSPTRKALFDSDVVQAITLLKRLDVHL